MDTRMRILKEAGILFGKMGIRAVTMDNIALELGISKRTIYEIFSDKNDLLEQAIFEGIKLHKRNMLNQLNSADNVIDAIVDFIRNHQKMFAKINPLFFIDLKRYHPKVYRKLNEKGELRDFSISRTLLEKGVKEGIFICNLNIDLSNKFFHEVMSFCKPDGEVGEVFSIKDIANSVFLPYLRGICTNKGLKLIDEIDLFKNMDNENQL